MHSRRQFLQSSAAVAVGALAARHGFALDAAPAAKASELITGKVDALRIHTAVPLVMESPLKLLDQHFVTPVEHLFVRNNFAPVGDATIAGGDAKGWKIELVALDGGAASIDFDSLQALPQTEVEMVLQCSGNGRAMYSRAAETSGTQWGRGGIGNVRFAGPRLADVMSQAKFNVPTDARYLCAEGKDAPPPGKADFEHSVPIEDALAGGILALSLNGQPLPAIHGGPIRLVLPGYYGTVQMKWLGRLRFEAEESASEHHAVRYRTPNRLIQAGEAFDFNRENSTPTWKTKLASLVTSHEDGEHLPASKTKLSGYAWNDGAARIETVLVSSDEGATWRPAELKRSTSPYAWVRWESPITVKAGPNVFRVIATDALGRTQPPDGTIFWNPAGYEWRGMERLTLNGVV